MGHKKIQRIDPVSMALPDGGVDSHAHLDGPEFDQDRAEVIGRARKAGVSMIGNVFLGPEDFRERRHMFAGYPEIFYLLGIHPCDGLRCTEQCLEEMGDAFANEPRLRAVGEIGLDFHWNDCPGDVQMRTFAMQLKLAKKIGKPVVIHCREAERECLAMLERSGFAGYPLLWHCFGGDMAFAGRIIRNGWNISIPGAVTFPANEATRKALAEIPADRLLLETDCPYLSPVPWRGTRNEPAYTVFTARLVADARGEKPEELWLTCGANARRFFGV